MFICTVVHRWKENSSGKFNIFYICMNTYLLMYTKVYTTLKSENYECKYMYHGNLSFFRWKFIFSQLFLIASIIHTYSSEIYEVFMYKKYFFTFDSQKYLFFIWRGKKLDPFYGNSWAHNIASLCATVFEHGKIFRRVVRVS